MTAYLLCSGIAFASDVASNCPDCSDLDIGESLSFIQPAYKLNVGNDDSIEFRAVASGIGIGQTNPAPGAYPSYVDVSNAQVMAYKNSGLIQFYLQAGYYSTPSLGTVYERSNIEMKNSFGYIPLAYLTLAPSKNWSVSAGKINSFGGYESTFTYQNINIVRGLLWNQTSNVSRGVTATYSDGEITASMTLNDGFYSNHLSWLGALAGYQFNEQNSATLSWTGAIRSSSTDTYATPLAQDNSQIFNAIYTYKSSHWMVTPYLQYTYVPSNPSIGILGESQTKGMAILTNYRFQGEEINGFSLPFRLEYISSSGSSALNSPNLLYGVGSAAWSTTVTPTYQLSRYFIRGEISYVQALKATPGMAFGSSGSTNNQTRAMIELGLLY